MEKELLTSLCNYKNSQRATIFTTDVTYASWIQSWTSNNSQKQKLPQIRFTSALGMSVHRSYLPEKQHFMQLAPYPFTWLASNINLEISLF